MAETEVVYVIGYLTENDAMSRSESAWNDSNPTGLDPSSTTTHLFAVTEGSVGDFAVMTPDIARYLNLFPPLERVNKRTESELELIDWFPNNPSRLNPRGFSRRAEDD